jgi:spermidine/putrescine transport system permease protein
VTSSEKLTRWIVTSPPTLFLLAFFLAPALIVVFASVREPGEFGGLAPWAGASWEAYR